MYLITFSKAGRDDIVLTEDDLFDFQYEASCFSGESFELGGVNARKLYLLIDNNTQRFSRGTFAGSHIKLEIDGVFMGYYNAELPKRRNGVIELTAYDNMVKLDVEFPADYTFPQTFWAVYAQCVYEAGLADEISFDNVILNGVWNNGVISADYTDYIYANSCRKLVSGMAEWNGGYARINDDGKLQIDKFSKTVTKQYSYGELMELDYSDETVTFTKIKTSQKNKTYEMGTDDGYTLVINNQYISYGLDDSSFELYFQKIYDYYNGFTLTPMTFTLTEPDLELHIGDRVQVFDEEEQVTITGNVSKIEITGNCSMTVTCGGFENVTSSSNYTPTSFSQIQQSKQEAKSDNAGSSMTSLISYQYLTDTSVKLNGVTYTVEKNADTGLISKISDSNGNSLEPEISAGITDVATHNAVLWAVAMVRELSSSPTIMPVTTGLVGYFDYKQQCAVSLWTNRLSGENIAITGSATLSDECLKMPDGTYGVFPMTYSGDFTLYAVVKADYDSTQNRHDCIIGSSSGDNAGGWRTISADGYSTDEQHFRCWFSDTYGGGIGTELTDGSTEKAYEKYSVVVLVQSGGKLRMYINGTASADNPEVTVKYGDYWGLNCLASPSGGVHQPSNTSSYFKMFAIGNAAHSADQVARNTAWLKEYYKL